MTIIRTLKKEILQRLIPSQAVILYGARRVGKTTLIKIIMEELSAKNEKIKFINAENSIQRDEITSENFYVLETLLKNYNYLIIDEAQKIANIGQILKIIIDNIPNIRILVTGSASFELANQIGEPLTGRKKTLLLYPIAISEIYQNNTQINQQIEERLIFGSYPKIFDLSDTQQKKEELFEIVESYLYRDILAIDGIKNSRKIRDLLLLLALQVGNEVSLNEIANNLALHTTTVARYLDLLEKVFVIYRLAAFSRNLRKEIAKSAKYYFCDNGIRNALINNFNSLKMRDDVGKLWENFLITERLKLLSNQREFANRYFWRTYDQKEIDLIEERNGQLYAFEFKYQSDKFKVPQEFLKTYKNSNFTLINNKNYIEFVTKI